jgi:hypothetical protein
VPAGAHRNRGLHPRRDHQVGGGWQVGEQLPDTAVHGGMPDEVKVVDDEREGSALGPQFGNEARECELCGVCRRDERRQRRKPDIGTDSADGEHDPRPEAPRIGVLRLDGQPRDISVVGPGISARSGSGRKSGRLPRARRGGHERQAARPHTLQFLEDVRAVDQSLSASGRRQLCLRRRCRGEVGLGSGTALPAVPAAGNAPLHLGPGR